jgi:hypothetical protein
MGASDSPEVNGWVVAAWEQLLVAGALLSRAPSGIDALDVLIDTGHGPRPVEWIALRRLAIDLAGIYGVDVTTTRLAHGVLFHVAPGRATHQRRPAPASEQQTVPPDRGAWWQRWWWALPGGLLLLASWVATL